MKKLNLQLGSIKEMLTKEQMKKIAGGGDYDDGGGSGSLSCSCQCNGVGTWTGTYENQAAVDNAIAAYCRNGGSCSC